MHRFTLVLLLLAVAVGPAVAIKCKAYMGDGLSTPADTPEAECPEGVTMCYRAHSSVDAGGAIAGCHPDGTCETFNAGIELVKALGGSVDGKCSTCDTVCCESPAACRCMQKRVCTCAMMFRVSDPASRGPYRISATAPPVCTTPSHVSFCRPLSRSCLHSMSETCGSAGHS